MFIQKDNLVIRHATQGDARILGNWWRDGTIMAHAGFPHGLDVSYEEIASSLSTDSDDTRRRLIIEVDDKPIGEMSYRNKGNKIAEIGIKICDSTMQERGYGTRFLCMLIEVLLYEQRYEKITLDTNLENTRAQHVYEKIGFRKVSINHNSWKDQLGRPQSSVEYELTEEDYVRQTGPYDTTCKSRANC